MEDVRWIPVGIVVSVALAATAQGTAAGAGRCEPPVRGPAGLPAAVVVTTDCGRFVLARDGRARSDGPARLPVPRGASWFADLTWYRVERGRLVIGRRHRLLWRSRRTYGNGYGVGVAKASADHVAFSFLRRKRWRLYVAPLTGAERFVATDETPLAWTHAGRLVTLKRGRLLLRDAGGGLERIIAVAAVNPVVDHANGWIYFVRRRSVFRFDGRRVHELASLARLRLAGTPILEPTRRVLAVHTLRRLVVLGPEGTVVATAALPRRRARADGVSSAIVAKANGDVAFTATSGNTASGSRGVETIYLLRRGSERAETLYRRHLRFEVCERGASLAWRRGWLLYAASEGRAVAVAADGRGVRDLSPFTQRLRRADGDGSGRFEVTWL